MDQRRELTKRILLNGRRIWWVEYEIYKNFTSAVLGCHRRALVTLPMPQAPAQAAQAADSTCIREQVMGTEGGWAQACPSLGVLYMWMYIAVALRNPSRF